MKKLLSISFTLAFMYLLNNSVYSQGWIMEESDNGVTYINNGWIKTLANDMDEIPITSIFNADSRTIVMINEGDMTYAKGSIEDYCNAVISMRDDMNKQMPAEQLKLMEDMIAQEKAKPAPKVSVQKSNSESIAGYNTTKYSISVDGELFEEKWISNDAALSDLIQIMNKSIDITFKLAGCSVPDESFLKNAPEFSETYKNVERSGIELKSLSYEYGSADPGTEVIRLEKEDISSEEFDVPEGYQEMILKEFIMAMSGM